MRDGLTAAALEQITRWQELSLKDDFQRTPEEVCLATFWRQATPGVSYYRCLLPARHLPGQMVGFDTAEVAWDDERDELSLPKHRGTAVWSFLGDDARARIALAWQDLGHRTLMECDDNYTKSPGKWGMNWGEQHGEGIIGYSHQQHRHLAGIVDGMIVSTPYLADVYADFNEHVYVARNSIDPYDWQAVKRPKPDGTTRIVYAGSNVHVFDFPIVKKALKWANSQDGVEATLWGFDRPPAWSGPMGEWVDGLAEYRKGLARYDIGVAPLTDNRWNACKSDVKALEYAMAGALPVVARTEAYSPWWRDNDWPYVAQTEAEWQAIIRHLVKNPEEVREGAAAAKEYVLRERTIHHEIHAWKEAVLGA